MFQELRECAGRVFIDSTPEFGVPASNVVDYSQVKNKLRSKILLKFGLLINKIMDKIIWVSIKILSSGITKLTTLNLLFFKNLSKATDRSKFIFFQVDVILISNYSCMLALPFVTEGTGFHGVVYATEPTLQIGRLFLEELVQTVERSPKAVSAKHWKALQHLLPPPLNEAPFPKAWRQLFDAKRVAASLSKIQMVGYNEKLVNLRPFEE